MRFSAAFAGARVATLAVTIQALKLSITYRRPESPVWQVRYYDFNVPNEEKRVEKRRYIVGNLAVLADA